MPFVHISHSGPIWSIHLATESTDGAGGAPQSAQKHGVNIRGTYRTVSRLEGAAGAATGWLGVAPSLPLPAVVAAPTLPTLKFAPPGDVLRGAKPLLALHTGVDAAPLQLARGERSYVPLQLLRLTASLSLWEISSCSHVVAFTSGSDQSQTPGVSKLGLGDVSQLTFGPTEMPPGVAR